MGQANNNDALEQIRTIFYPGTHFDYWFTVLSRITLKSMKVCEIGSGSGSGFQNQLYPDVEYIFGIDLDSRVLKNKFLTESAHGSAYDLKKITKGIKFDLIYSHMVVEHMESPDKFIAAQIECLSRDGRIMHSTVSKYYWSSLLNKIVPDKFKNFMIVRLGSGRPAEDVFPAYYRLNSESDVRALAAKFNLHYELIRMDQAPGYLRQSMVLMLLFTVIHKPLQMLFPALRPTLIFILSKKH